MWYWGKTDQVTFGKSLGLSAPKEETREMIIVILSHLIKPVSVYMLVNFEFVFFILHKWNMLEQKGMSEWESCGWVEAVVTEIN